MIDPAPFLMISGERREGEGNPKMIRRTQDIYAFAPRSISVMQPSTCISKTSTMRSFNSINKETSFGTPKLMTLTALKLINFTSKTKTEDD